MMENTIISQITAYLLFFILLSSFVIIALVKGNDIWDGIKGDNGRLDGNEIVIIVWCICFVGIVLGDLFFSLTVQDGVWMSLDLVLIATLGLKGVENKWKK